MLLSNQAFLEKLQRLRIIFVGGKGGVGKTTTAASLATYFAERLHKKVLVISTDPAHSLGDAFNVKLAGRVKSLSEHLDALELDPTRIVAEHFAGIEATLSRYTKPEMMPKLREFLALSRHSPGAEEAAMLEAVCREMVKVKATCNAACHHHDHSYHSYDHLTPYAHYDHIIFDTAPTGHTLRLLALPEMMQAWTDGLLMQQRYQATLRDAARQLDTQVHVLAQQKEDIRFANALETLKRRRDLFARARGLMHDKNTSGVVLVLIPEVLPLVETERALERLALANLPCAGLVVNQIIPTKQQEYFWQQRESRQGEILARIEQSLERFDYCHIPLQARDIRGTAHLADFFAV